MAYTPPTYNAVDVDLMPSAAPAVVIPTFNAVSVDLSDEDSSGGGPGSDIISDNARLRNYAILLAI
jgi:hypothetical protein